MALNYNTENFSKNVKVLALRNDELGNAAWWYRDVDMLRLLLLRHMVEYFSLIYYV